MDECVNHNERVAPLRQSVPRQHCKMRVAHSDAARGVPRSNHKQKQHSKLNIGFFFNGPWWETRYDASFPKWRTARAMVLPPFYVLVLADIESRSLCDSKFEATSSTNSSQAANETDQHRTGAATCTYLRHLQDGIGGFRKR